MKQESINKIKATIAQLKQQGIKQTQKRVSEESKLSIITVRRYWKECRLSSNSKRISSEAERISSSSKKASINTDSDFERFRRRKPSGNIQINPWDL